MTESEEQKLLEILRKYKEAIPWSIEDLKGISPSICMHKILLNDNAKTSIEHQRRLNHVMKEVVRKEVLKWLNAGFIYAISDSSWVSPVHMVRGGNRAGRDGLKLARFFQAKILTAQPALKTGPVGLNSLFKAKKNSGGAGRVGPYRVGPCRAKFGLIFFGPII